MNWLDRSTPNDVEPASAPQLRPPRAAAFAGVLFSVLMIVSLGIIHVARPDPGNTNLWLTDPSRRNALRLALHLVPFAGISFLWFMGVLRNRLGKLEDQFFATVFLGSGLLFVASLFAAAAIAGAFSEESISGVDRFPSVETFDLARRLIRAVLNVFAIKMAAVFMFSTCTIALRSAFLPRWIAFSGFACGLVLLGAITNWDGIPLILPLWLLLVSAWILIVDFGRKQAV
jgi:hypothetical protein